MALRSSRKNNNPKRKIFSTTRILGVRIFSITYRVTLREVQRWIVKRENNYVCIAAAHLVMECQNNERLREGVNRAGLVTPDGMPLVWLLKLFGNKRVERVYGPMLMQRLCALSAIKKWRILLLGGDTGQSDRLRKRLAQLHPELRIVGAIDTPVRPISDIKNHTIIRQINYSKADIVFVGLGCPWQELWMSENRPLLRPAVLVGVGAAFDFISGRQRQAPVWMQHIGLEWLFRVLQEPKRLWYRYTVVNTIFVWRVLKQILRDFLLH